MNIAFFGTNNIFSSTVFRHLSNSLLAINIKIVVLPKKPRFASRPLPKHAQLRRVPCFSETIDDTETLARHKAIPLIFDAELSAAQISQQLTRHSIDLIIVACFPSLIPEILLDTSVCGAINIHPSLLPKYRGPAPVFWQLQNNENRTGVSLHVISQQLDAGDIILQRKIDIPNDANGRDIDSLLALSGAKLLTKLCIDIKTLQRYIASATPQQDQHASYQHSPCASSDFHLNLNWSAQHAYRFMRGTEHLQIPYLVSLNDTNILLTQPISFSEKHGSQTLQYEDKKILSINFRRGCLRAKYTNEHVKKFDNAADVQIDNF